MNGNDFEIGSGEEVGDIAQLVQAFRNRPLFVSTIRASISHRVAFLMFHESAVPFIGIAVAVRGMDWFEGELLRSGPHRFEISRVVDRDSGAKLWLLSSMDRSFRIAAKEIQMRHDQKWGS